MSLQKKNHQNLDNFGALGLHAETDDFMSIVRVRVRVYRCSENVIICGYSYELSWIKMGSYFPVKPWA